MLILRDFKCEDCSKVFEELTEQMNESCPECGGNSNMTITKASVQGCESFNPHFDQQAGQWFESKEHKNAVLKAMGRRQVSGNASPRESSKIRINMTRKQAEKFDPFMNMRFKEEVASNTHGGKKDD